MQMHNMPRGLVLSLTPNLAGRPRSFKFVNSHHQQHRQTLQLTLTLTLTQTLTLSPMTTTTVTLSLSCRARAVTAPLTSPPPQGTTNPNHVPDPNPNSSTVHTQHTNALLPLFCSSPSAFAHAALPSSPTAPLQPLNSYDDHLPSRPLCFSDRLFLSLFRCRSPSTMQVTVPNSTTTPVYLALSRAPIQTQ